MLQTLGGCATGPKPADAGSAAATGGTAAQAHQRVIEAYNGCNEGLFVAAYAPLFTFATSNTRQPVTTRDGLQRYLAVGCGSRPNPTVSLVQQSTRVSGAITVFAGQYRFKVPAPGAAGAAGTTIDVLQNFTMVLERMGERWLVLAHHVSVAP
ncbi:MAG: DUF4440 domain-containing protein [Rubrivivax sp.]|nr:DUF4440 domain-containing protein [Rubrivivax sp.]